MNPPKHLRLDIISSDRQELLEQLWCDVAPTISPDLLELIPVYRKIPLRHRLFIKPSSIKFDGIIYSTQQFKTIQKSENK